MTRVKSNNNILIQRANKCKEQRNIGTQTYDLFSRNFKDLRDIKIISSDE